MKTGHKTDMLPAKQSPGMFTQGVEVYAVDNHLAAGRFIDAADEVQKGRFSRAATAQEHDKFTPVYSRV